MNQWPKTVNLVEVGPRDGLQNERTPLSLEQKTAFINQLSECGYRRIEIGSFVREDRVPQMAESDLLTRQLRRKDGVHYPVLVPNLKGLERALACGSDEISVFTATSDTFSRKNTGMSVSESLSEIRTIIKHSRGKASRMRAYLSTVVHCPYEGEMDPSRAAEISKQLLDMGCDEISLGETLGTASPAHIRRLLDKVCHGLDPQQLAVHFHDTMGMALANILLALDYDIRTIDSSIAGLGGCPYAPGAQGNVASEDVAHMLEQMGIETGLNLEKIALTGEWICSQLGRKNLSRYSQAKSNTERK